MEPGDLLKIHLKNGDKVQLELVEFDQEKLVGRTVRIGNLGRVISKKSLRKSMEVHYKDVKMIQHHEKQENNDDLGDFLLLGVLCELVFIGATLLVID